VVPGTPRDHRSDHPASAALVVEVSDPSLPTDRGLKASLYASAGISEYWILNLVENSLEVYRDPQPATEQPFGHEYVSITRHSSGESVTALEASQPVTVADLLP
jgi:Uma2 family endonuclease